MAELPALIIRCDDSTNPLLWDPDAPVERKKAGEPEESFLLRVCRTHKGATLLTDLYYPYEAAFLMKLANHCSGIALMEYADQRQVQIDILPGVAFQDNRYPAKLTWQLPARRCPSHL